MHWVDDPEQRRTMVDAMLAWSTPMHFVYIDVAGTGLLVGEAERQGKVVVATELGGGGHVHAATHRIALDGLATCCATVGVLAGEVDDARVARARAGGDRAGDRRRQLPLRPGRRPLGDVRRPRATASSRASSSADPLHRPARPRADAACTRRLDGVVCVVRAIAPTYQGDNVLVIGREVDVAELA